MKRVLIVCAVDKEARAIGQQDRCTLITSGLGRTNAAAATTEAIVSHGPFDAVLNVGVAGALPGSDLAIGDVVVARECVYAEEGLITPDGFEDVRALGFALGDFVGNRVPVDTGLLRKLTTFARVDPIATVATASGTDEAAQTIRRRTGAVAEAMEGAAVVHAARRLNTSAIEVRVISNTTGDRAGQKWDLPAAIGRLNNITSGVIRRIESE